MSQSDARSNRGKCRLILSLRRCLQGDLMDMNAALTKEGTETNTCASAVPNQQIFGPVKQVDLLSNTDI